MGAGRLYDSYAGEQPDIQPPDLITNGDLSTQGMIKKVKYSVSGREPEKRGAFLVLSPQWEGVGEGAE